MIVSSSFYIQYFGKNLEWSAFFQRVHKAVKENKDIQILQMDQINHEQEIYLDQYYYKNIFPLLTPMAVDVTHPFPVFLNKNYFNLAVLLKNNKLEQTNPLFAIVGVPCAVPSFLKLPSVGNELQFVSVEQLIEKYLDTLFLGYDILSVSPIYLIEKVEEKEEVSQMSDVWGKNFKKSKTTTVFQLIVEEKIAPFLKEIIKHSPQLKDKDIYYTKKPLDFSLFQILNIYNEVDYSMDRVKNLQNKRVKQIKLAEL